MGSVELVGTRISQSHGLEIVKVLLRVAREVQNALVFRFLVEELFLVLEGRKLRLDLTVIPQLVLRAALDDFQSLQVLIE